MITQSTYSPSNPERVADWYTKAVYSGYPLITGMRNAQTEHPNAAKAAKETQQ